MKPTDEEKQAAIDAYVEARLDQDAKWREFCRIETIYSKTVPIVQQCRTECVKIGALGRANKALAEATIKDIDSNPLCKDCQGGKGREKLRKALEAILRWAQSDPSEPAERCLHEIEELAKKALEH